MPDFATRLVDGWERALRNLPLALVPIAFGLLDTNKILTVLGFQGGHVGLKFGLPVSVVTLWQFVSVPNTGVAVNTGLPVELLPLAVLTVPILLVVQAAVTAGYFGGIRNALDGEPYAFARNASEYFVPFLIMTVVPFLLILPLALGVFGAGAAGAGVGGATVLVLLVAMVALLVGSYLFYATPYLVVLRDAGVLEAARRSYELATEGGPYLSYAAGFVGLVVLVSPFATLLVVNVPALGLPVGILGGGVFGLALNVATMRFVADVDDGSAVATRWESEGVDATG